MAFTTEEGTFKSLIDGFTLFARCWVPTGELKGVLIIAHGYQEHSGRYEKLAGPLAEKGIAVYSMDHRSHGQSEFEKGMKGYFTNFDSIVRDFDHYAGLVFDAFSQQQGKPVAPEFAKVLSGGSDPAPEGATPVLPVFLYGHSMGGLIATNCVVRFSKPYAGLIASSAFLRGLVQPGYLTIAANYTIAALFPMLPFSPVNAEYISSSEAEVEAYKSDPLNGTEPVRAAVGREFLSNQAMIGERFSEVKLPVLIMHGTSDKLASIEGSEALYSACQSQDKTFSEYEGAYHELLNETPEITQKYLKETVDWLDARLSTSQ